VSELDSGAAARASPSVTRGRASKPHGHTVQKPRTALFFTPCYGAASALHRHPLRYRFLQYKLSTIRLAAFCFAEPVRSAVALRRPASSSIGIDGLPVHSVFCGAPRYACKSPPAHRLHLSFNGLGHAAWTLCRLVERGFGARRGG
jgi:hypothetical protein